MMKILNEMNVLIDGEESDYKAFRVQISDDEAISLIHVRTLEALSGAEVEYINEGNINIETGFESIELPIDKTICIDAGHGGTDSGAVDPIQTSKGDKINTLEKVLNRKVADKTIKKLKELGFKVIETRAGDTTMSLNDRVKIANNANVDMFISIHFNAASPGAHGIETFKYRNTKNPVSHKLAENVHKQLIQNTKLYDRGVKESGFYVIKYTNMPAILVELGFITNDKEEKTINDNKFLEKCANSIVNGILDTL